MSYPYLSYFRATCIAIILLLCIVTGAAAAINTPMFRADPQHTGVYDNGGINPDGILVWKFTTGGGVDSSPTVTNGVVYTGSNDKNVYAFNAATGVKIWNYTTEGPVFSSPAVVNGIVYIGSGEGNIQTQVYKGTVYALDAVTGTKIWHYSTGGLVSSSPVVMDGVVYIGSADDNVYALNAATGTEIWHNKIGEMFSSPAVANGVVYVGSGNHNVYALNATTGDEIWHYSTGYWITSSPTIANGVVYVGSYDHNVYAINATTGVEIWRYATGSPVLSSPAVANGVVFIGSNDKNVYALDAKTGLEIWRFITGANVVSNPAVANGVVYVGSNDNNVYALNAATGTEVWHYSTGSLVSSSPAIANGVVYIGSNDKNVYAIGSSPDNTGSISFSSTPSGAQIYLGGNNSGHTTSYTLAGITAGQHAVMLKLAGYQDYNQNVTVIAGQTAIVHAALSPEGWVPITAPCVISSPGHYRLTNDLSNSSVDTAIRITASDVLLDGNGHTLTGGLLDNTYGVFVANDGESLDNITIVNLMTNKWGRGIHIQNSSYVKIFNCTSIENFQGLSILGVRDAAIEQCNLSHNIPDPQLFEAWGLNIINSERIEVKGNDIHSNKPFDPPYSSSGIVCSNSEVVISGNHIWDQDGAGILLGRSDQGKVTIRDNLIDNFVGTGISVDTNIDGVPVLIVNNTINAPDGTIGILISRTDSVNITSNTISTKYRGITIVNSANDILSHNTITGSLTGFALIGNGNIPYYYHSIDETNTVDGKPIRYFKDIKGPFIDHSVDAATIIAINCTDGIITGQSLSKNNDGILFVGCRNMTVSNSVLNNNFDGIESYNSETCVFRDVVTSGNDFIGLVSNGDSNLSLINYTSNNNVAFGLILQNSEGFIVRNSVMNTNGGGITAGAGISASNSRGSITGVTALENEKFGILSMFSSVISITDSHISNTHGNGLQVEKAVCTIKNSEIAGSENTGVTVYNEGASVQMSGCTIRDNDHAGIWFSDAAGVTPSIISNNIFNNTLNLLIEEDNDPITWNTSKTAGTNIVNGPFLGGNYWASPDGTGWSQVTPDRGDGFCNAPFVIDANNTDYLPLHLFQGEIPITAPCVISSPGHYRLTNDLSNSSVDTAIRITASDVLLDGNGHTLTGGLLDNTYGVFVANDGESLNNITIVNLMTNKWERGIHIQNSSYVKIFNCTSIENFQGLSILGVQDAAIEQCNLSQNILDPHLFEAWGLNIINSERIEVKGNDIHSNKPFETPYSSSGIVCTNSQVVISGNHIWDQDGAGILLGRSNQGKVTIRDNVIDNFAGTGISVDTNIDGVPVLIVNNTINAPDGIIGILTVGTDSVNITSNTISSKYRGITIINSANDILSHNTITGSLIGFALMGNGNIPYYYHSIDETNTVDGKPIRYFKDIKGPFIDHSVDAATIIAINCTDGIITGQSLSKNNDGILFVGCRNMTVSNSVLNNNFDGIESYNSETCVFRDVVTSGNDFIGLASNGDSNLSLINYTSNNNVAFGLILQNSEGFVVRNSVLNNNGEGIPDGAGISASNSRGSVTNVTASENQLFGILVMSDSVISISDSRITDTHGNGLQAENSECNVNNSEIAGSENSGVTIYNEGASVQMSGCTIRDNDHAGIWFSEAYGDTPSIISNTIFNNTLNALIEGDNDPITWNTSKTAGTNIVNGPFLGGNYWASPDGTGWSQVTPDRGDGFCNAPFVIDDGNIDYLPLHTYTKPAFYADFSVSPTSGTAPLKVTCTDKSTGNPTRFMYDFGDGVNVSGPNPVHTYRYPGTFSITLTITKYNSATNSIIGTSTIKTNIITVRNVPFVLPVAKFTASPTIGTAPFTVQFTDHSSGNPTRYNYDFGDGVNMTGPNPLHTYRYPGVYNVTLTVLKNDASNGSIVSNASIQNGLIVVN